jgi:glutamate formiminotransferase
VLTFAGEAEPVAVAMESAVAVALERIDMERHEGQHPRIGAVDVIPFVPLGDTTLDDCVELARRFAARIADRFQLPVYLYGKAATRPERELLADLRRPQYEGLKELIAQRGREPDHGPPKLHPTGGAVAVGARPFLIAYNINLASADVDLAKRIAHRIRERSGGLPRVQALGLFLEELDCAQVSMNLLDFTVTPMWRAWETVRALAADEGVELRESELIGLAPQAALLDVADHVGVPADESIEARVTAAAEWLQIRDFEPTKALELRLAAASAAPAPADR